MSAKTTPPRPTSESVAPGTSIRRPGSGGEAGTAPAMSTSATAPSGTLTREGPRRTGAERQVEGEDPPPREGVDEQAAKRRPGGDGGRGRRRPRTDRAG